MRYDFQKLLEGAKAFLEEKDKVREEGLSLCREITRNSAFSIRALHQGNLEEAEKLWKEAKSLHDKLLLLLLDHPDLRYSGFVQDAEKELMEARTVLAIKKGEEIPSLDSLNITYPSYLNGLGEAMGEVRRMLLDNIRMGKVRECEELLHLMEEVYYALSSLLYPDAITGNLRRQVDMIRGVLERSRGDLTLATMMFPPGNEDPKP